MPSTADWNGDGLPDILLSDATAKYRLYLNTGRTQPVLDRERILKLTASTSTAPGGSSPARDRMACIAYDDDNDFHLYWRSDDQATRIAAPAGPTARP